MSGAISSAVEQAVAAAKFEQRDTRSPLQAGSYGFNGGVCTCYGTYDPGSTGAITVSAGCPLHGHMETVVVVPAKEWNALVTACREGVA